MGHSRTLLPIWKLGAAALVIGLAIVLVWRLLHQPPAARAGRSVPTFALPQLTKAGKLSLASFKGRPVVLNFWASDCVPCKQEMPALKKLAHRSSAGSLAIVGVVEQDSRADAKRYALSHALNFANVFDADYDVAGRFRVIGTPETFVLDREHRLVARLTGPITLTRNRERLNTEIRAVTS